MSYDDDIVTDKDKVRLLIGDTNTDNEYLSDSEIWYFLDANNNDVLTAAIDSAEAIASSLAPEVSYQASTLRQEANQAFEHFNKVADRLQRRAERGLGLPVFVHSGDEPSDPSFWKEMHDFSAPAPPESV